MEFIVYLVRSPDSDRAKATGWRANEIFYCSILYFSTSTHSNCGYSFMFCEITTVQPHLTQPHWSFTILFRASIVIVVLLIIHLLWVAVTLDGIVKTDDSVPSFIGEKSYVINSFP